MALRYTCKICGFIFNYKITRGTQVCSKECHKKLLSEMRMGDKNPRFNNGWRQWHKYKPDLKECEICNKEKKLEVHHVDANKRNNDFTNLIRVCRFCHMKLDGRFKNLNYYNSATGLCAGGDANA